MNISSSFGLASIVMVGALTACSSSTLDGGSAKTDGGDDAGPEGGPSGSSGTSDRINRRLGEGCDLDAQCLSGLTCRQNFVADQCTTQKTCTLVCQGDAPCQAFNAKGMCFQGCGDEQICMLTP